MNLEISLEGKVVLVSGGCLGSGAETMRLFAQLGARVVFMVCCYESTRNAADELVAACGEPERCRAVQQDLGSVEEVAPCWTRQRRFGEGWTRWWSTTGIGRRITRPSTSWSVSIGVNLDSVFGLVKAAVAQFESRPSAEHIVFVAGLQRSRVKHSTRNILRPKARSLPSPRVLPANWQVQDFSELRRSGLDCHQHVGAWTGPAACWLWTGRRRSG